MLLRLLLIIQFLSLFAIIFILLKLSFGIYIKNGGENIFDVKSGE